jgi:ABC-type multidrug transport system fused ATPase/permease subunit
VIAVFNRRRAGLFAVLVTTSLAHAGAAVVGAYCVQHAFDRLFGDGAAGPSVVVLSAVFVMTMLAGAAFEVLRGRLSEQIGLDYTSEIRTTLFSRLVNASAFALGRRAQGTLLLPFLGDLTALKRWISDGLVRLIAAGVLAIVLLTALTAYSVRMAAAAAAILLLASLAMAALRQPLGEVIRETRQRRGALANFVASSLRSATTIQAFSRFSRERARLIKRTDALMRAGLRLGVVSGVGGAIVHIAAAALIGAVLLTGAAEATRGGLSAGAVVAALSLVGLLGGGVRDLGVAFDLWQRARVSFEKVERALAVTPAVEPHAARGPLRLRSAEVKFENVTAEGAFSKLSAIVPEGAVVHVVGPSGSGKSALLQLIARLRDPARGRVRIGGQDLRRVSLGSLRRRVGLASEAAPLMRGSLSMNLTYRAPNASAAECEAVIAECGLNDLFARFPAGAQHRVSEGSAELAVGDRHRLMIARAMLGTPPILLLDEVDAHLSEAVRIQIARTLITWPGTVFMIASTTEFAAVTTHVLQLGGAGGAKLTELASMRADVDDLSPAKDAS